MQLECVHRRVVIGRDEHQLGRRGEAAQHPAELEPVEVGHADVEEDRVVGLGRGLDQRVVAVVGALDLLDARGVAQQPRQILELSALVVDGEDGELIAAHRAAPAAAAGAGSAVLADEVGDGHDRRRAPPQLGLELQRVALAERRSQAAVDVGQADAAARAGQEPGQPVGVDPAAVIGDPQLDVLAHDAGAHRHPSRARASFDAMTDGILHQRLHRHRRYDRPQRLGRHVDRHPQRVKPGLLEAQVALDMLELLGQRHVRAAVAEQVAGELGEVDEQLARIVGAGVDVAGDGGQRVVDEVRRDLGAQRTQLGPGQALLLVGHHRQLQLSGDEAGGLHDHAHLAGRRTARPPVERDQRPRATALDEQRRQDRGAQRAARVRGREPGLDARAVVAGARQEPAEHVAGANLITALAVDGEHGAGVGQRHGRRAREPAQVRDRQGRRSWGRGPRRR